MAYVQFILILLVIPSISTGIEPYTVSVEADDKLAEFSDIFRKTLAKYGHVRIEFILYCKKQGVQKVPLHDHC